MRIEEHDRCPTGARGRALGALSAHLVPMDAPWAPTVPIPCPWARSGRAPEMDIMQLRVLTDFHIV